MSLTPDIGVMVRPPTWSRCPVCLRCLQVTICDSSQAPAPSTWSLQSPDKPPALTRSVTMLEDGHDITMLQCPPLSHVPLPPLCQWSGCHYRMPVSVPKILSDDENIILNVRCPVLSLSPSELNLPGLGPRLKPRPGPSSSPG